MSETKLISTHCSLPWHGKACCGGGKFTYELQGKMGQRSGMYPRNRYRPWMRNAQCVKCGGNLRAENEEAAMWQDVASCNGDSF